MAPANARSQLKDHVRHVLGGIAVPAEMAFPEKLGKTRSGKIMRRRLKAQELGETWEISRRSRSRAVVQQPGKRPMYKVAVRIIHDVLGTG
jgi:hypothetical protein